MRSAQNNPILMLTIFRKTFIEIQIVKLTSTKDVRMLGNAIEV